MNYPDLLTNVLAWSNRPEIEQAIPTFVELAEADINRALSQAGLVGSQKRATASIDTAFDQAPDDLARVERLVLTDTGHEVESVTAAGFEAIAARDPDRTGEPQYFTLMGSELRFYPAPDASYPVQLIYQTRIDPLTAGNASNWVLLGYPDTYLYGALVKAGEYLADDEMKQRFSALFRQAIDTLVVAERDRRGHQRAAGYRPDLPLSRGHSRQNPLI